MLVNGVNLSKIQNRDLPWIERAKVAILTAMPGDVKRVQLPGETFPRPQFSDQFFHRMSTVMQSAFFVVVHGLENAICTGGFGTEYFRSTFRALQCYSSLALANKLHENGFLTIENDRLFTVNARTFINSDSSLPHIHPYDNRVTLESLGYLKNTPGSLAVHEITGEQSEHELQFIVPPDNLGEKIEIDSSDPYILFYLNGLVAHSSEIPKGESRNVALVKILLKDLKTPIVYEQDQISTFVAM